MLKFKSILIISFIAILFAGCSTKAPDYTPLNSDYSAVLTESIKYEISQGNLDNYKVVHKFGGGLMTTSFQPVTQSGFYRTPTTATTLEILSDSVADTFGGAGAQQVTIVGLNSSWDEIEFVVNMSGTTPVTLPHDMLRIYRWYVSSSGTYATQAAGSHQGTLTIRESGAGQTWSVIPLTPFPTGQSQIGAYTIPKGYVGYILGKNIFTDTSKTADFYFFQRQNANDTTSPYSGNMRLIEREVGVQGGYQVSFEIPKGPIVGPADVGYIGYVSSGTTDVSVEFELVLVKIN